MKGLGELLPLFCVVILVFSFFFQLHAHGGCAPCWYACPLLVCLFIKQRTRLLLMVLFWIHPRRTDVCFNVGCFALLLSAGEDSMTPGTHLPGTIYQVGFFSTMYKYTAVIMLAGDVAFFYTSHHNNWCSECGVMKTLLLSHEKTVWYEARTNNIGHGMTRHTRGTYVPVSYTHLTLPTIYSV